MYAYKHTFMLFHMELIYKDKVVIIKYKTQEIYLLININVFTGQINLEYNLNLSDDGLCLAL